MNRSCLLGSVARSLSAYGQWVCLFVCLFVCLCVCPFYKTVVNIRRFSLAHCQQVVTIRRFSLSLQKSGEYSHVSASSLQNSGEYSNVCASPLQQSGEYSKVLVVCVFACLFVFYKKAVNIRRFSLSLPKSDEYSNVSASPVKQSGEYSKVFAFRLQKSHEYSKFFASPLQKVVNIQRFSVSPLGFSGLLGFIRFARGGVRAGSCAFPASHRLLGHPCECSQVLAQHSKPNALPVPSSPRFPKGPWCCRGATFFEK